MILDLSIKLKALIDGTTDVLKVIDTFEKWDVQRKEEFITTSFLDQINFIYKEVPYYHQLFIDNGIYPTDFHSIVDINKIPALTKDILRSNYEMLRPKNLNSNNYIRRRSGGTTGEPILSLVSNEARAYETFSYFRGLKWMGWRPSMTTVRLFGGSLGTRKNQSFREWVYEKSMNNIHIPAYELDKSNIRHYFEIIKNEKNICIIGYASAVNNLIFLLKENNLSLKNIELVITTSEQLIEDWRINIMNYCNSSIRSYFGCGEVESLGFQEYNKQDEYRIPVEHVYLENDQHSRLMITQLHNRAQPLIRYMNGDLCEIDSGKNNEFIQKLNGRTADYFYKKDGSKISPTFAAHSILVSLVPVKQYQYIQYKDNIIEFKYLMETGKLNISHKEKIQNIVNYVMGEETTVIFSETSLFERSSSLKHRICIYIDKPFSSHD